MRKEMNEVQRALNQIAHSFEHLSEREKCLQFIKKVGSRTEAFEDILWALINSTEFQTKR